MDMVRRILATVVAIVMVVVALAGVAALTGLQADAGTVTPLVSVEDVARALRGRGLEVSPTGKLVAHPRLSVAGEVLQVNGEPVTVYVFPSVEDRAVADQILLSQRQILSGDLVDATAGTRIVPVRNAMIVHDIQNPEIAVSVYRAANDLARMSVRA